MWRDSHPSCKVVLVYFDLLVTHLFVGRGTQISDNPLFPFSERAKANCGNSYPSFSAFRPLLEGNLPCRLAPDRTTRDIAGLNKAKAMPDVKGSMPAPAPADTHPTRPTETPKDLKKRVRGLDKSLTNVHERLVQTEKQIFDLERSYLEETRLYGNVLQGWDAYLDIKGKGTGDNILRGAKRGTKREAPADDAEDGEEEIGEACLVFAFCVLWTDCCDGMHVYP